MPLNAGRVVMYCFVLLGGAAFSELCSALDVNLTEVRPYVEVNVGDETILVKRIQDPAHTVDGFFAKTSRPCPPFCIRPMIASPGVKTIGEYEIFDFMSHQLRDGLGLIVDARTPDWYQRGTIPGAINVPWDRIVALSENPDGIVGLFKELGAANRADEGEWYTGFVEFVGANAKKDRSWDFSRSKQLILFCNGPWCDQSPRAIRALVGLGYPAEKILYYRGGMQVWVSLGLPTTVPQKSN
jgi:rhodanese-related sulfurtransferase